MPITVLDIGAGSLAFAKDLARSNPSVRMTIFCGEPRWGFGPFFRSVSQEKKQQILDRQQRGIWKIESCYSRFAFEDGSLDLVTLNAPHPFQGFGMKAPLALELDRCLKSGGIFFSSFPKFDYGAVLKGYELLDRGAWHKEYDMAVMCRDRMPPGLPVRFPQSPTISRNISVHRHGDPRAAGARYVYYDGISPGYRLWRKP